MNGISDQELHGVEKITSCFVDLDNTLWNGTLAEGEIVSLFADRWKTLEKLHCKGIQLFIVSKNDQLDVEKALTRLQIDKDLFTWMVVNWEPKYTNIEHVLRVTQIRPETALFIDDNEFELQEVKNKIPTIHFLNASDFSQVLSVPAIASRTHQTDGEIQERKNRYRTALEGEILRQGSIGDDAEFYRRLKREIRIGIVPPDNLERVVKLLVETHRLNFNPDKFAHYDETIDFLHGRINAGDRLYAVATSEAGVSLGLTGALLVRIENGCAMITDGTFSCGIIGRDFEAKTLLSLIQQFQQDGITSVEIEITLTSTNLRVRDILEKLGFKENERQMNEKRAVHTRYTLNIVNYVVEGRYDWISISTQPPEFDYIGHPHVIHFFNEHVKPRIKEGFSIANLGAARGEVLGLLQPSERKEYYDFLRQLRVHYTKIDMELIEGEDNAIANAENLTNILTDESQDIVMAVELLEHTERPWKVLSEMTRVCKRGGLIFISVPSFNFSKHEYPIDLWRFGSKTMRGFFDAPGYSIIQLETVGDTNFPRGVMILVQKSVDAKPLKIELPKGELDLKTGIMYFS